MLRYSKHIRAGNFAIEEVTTVLKQEAERGNVSAAKLILGRPSAEDDAPMSAYEQRALRTRMVLQVDVVASAAAAMERQRELLEGDEEV